MANQRKQEQINFEEAQLHFRNARTYNQWWSAICKAAEQMDFAWLSLKTKDKDGTVQTEVWRLANAQPGLSDVVIMTVPVRNHPTAAQMEFEIAILINGSLESVGRRGTLFSRLLDEYDIAALKDSG